MFKERRLTPEGRLATASFQIHRPKAVIEFRYPIAAVRHWVKPTQTCLSGFSKAASEKIQSMLVVNLQSGLW